MLNENELNNKVITGHTIRAIVNNKEWFVIEDMLKKEYMDAIKTLIDKEDEVARATIRGIDNLYYKITNGISMADKASAELVKLRFKT